MPNTFSQPRSNTTVLAGVVFIATLAAYVALELTGHDTDGLLVLVTPILAALFINDRLRSESAAQNRTLSEIKEQTNGVLNRRMEAAVAKGLKDAGLVEVTPAVEPVAPSPSPSTMADLPLTRG